MGELKDKYGRKITYLRLSITDRCNLRCRYCMPEEGVESKSHDDILSYEEIVKIVKNARDMGVRRVRVTGGEPLVRPEVFRLIAGLSQLGLEDISMTTNGVLLAEEAERLKNAGLNRVNISLDSLKVERYRQITRRDKLALVKDGIEKALLTGLKPVKINTVLLKDVNEDEVEDFLILSRDNPLHVRFIEYMPLGGEDEYQYSSLKEVKKDLLANYNLQKTNVSGGGPAEYYKLTQGKGTIGFISPLSNHFCQYCNRMRLTADGKIRPCLASDLEVSLPEKLTDDSIKNVLKKALALKPVGHNMNKKQFDSFKRNRDMYQIGG